MTRKKQPSGRVKDQRRLIRLRSDSKAMREIRKIIRDERVVSARVARSLMPEPSRVIPAPVGARKALDRPEDHEDWPLPVVDGG